MNKNIYEVFDDFEEALTKKQKIEVIEKNLTSTLVEVLRLTYHPDFVWTVKEIPDNYRVPADSGIPGISHASLSTEIRRLYLFQKEHPTSVALTEKRKEELLIQILESLEPREAEVVMGIFRKDQGVRGLNYKFVKEIFPSMLP